MRTDLVITGAVFALMGAVFVSYATVVMELIMQIYGFIFLMSGVIVLIIGGFLPDKKAIPKSSPVPQSGTINTSTSSYDEAQNIVRTRYAKGEITQEQYEQMKKDLEK